MADFEYKFIGWLTDEEENSDKVWALLALGDVTGWRGKYVSVYGRRGKKLRTTVYDDAQRYDMNKLITAKTKKGYVQYNESELAEVYPDFEKDLQKTAFWIALTT